MITVIRTQRTTLVVPTGPSSTPGPPGPPGSPGEGYATRGLMAARLAPALLDDVYLTEAWRAGKFIVESASNWTAEITADTDQGIFVASTADPTKVYRRVVEGRVRPEMFGAPPYNPSAEVWCHSALNAFYRLARNTRLARMYVFDASGEWGIADKIYAVYDGAEPTVDRRFIAPTFRVAPLASLPGGVPLDAAFDIAAFHSTWEGEIAVHPSGSALWGTAYATRRYNIGVRRRFCGGSTFGGVRVDDAIYEGVHDDSTGAFTADSISFPNSNNIGMEPGYILCRTCGSSEIGGFGNATPKTISSKVKGGNSSGGAFGTGEVWDATPATYINLSSQRTKLTLNNTTGLRARDMGWTRLELTPAIYGTIAAAVVTGPPASGTITWSTGDPTTYLNVGDLHPVFQAGPNAGIEFRITGFSGTSNRVIAVDRSPTAHAATADATYKQYGRAIWHKIAVVEDATHITVFPWVPDRNNSDFHIASGAALRVDGADSAVCNYATLEAFACGNAYWGTSLFSPKFGTVLMELCEIGARLGGADDANHFGVLMEHGHAEACRADIIVESYSITGKINLGSSYDFSKWVSLRPFFATTLQDPSSSKFGALKVDARGYILSASNANFNYDPDPYDTTFYGISNAPPLREVFLHDNSGTLTVTLDRDAARIFAKQHQAQLLWTGPSGGAPSGTLTLNLDASLAAQGWAFAGDGSGTSHAITAPGDHVLLKFSYLFTTKKVAITRINGA